MIVLRFSSTSDPAAMGAASTSTFFTHWRGRNALIMPSARFFGGLCLVEGIASPPVCGSEPRMPACSLVIYVSLLILEIVSAVTAPTSAPAATSVG